MIECSLDASRPKEDAFFVKIAIGSPLVHKTITITFTGATFVRILLVQSQINWQPEMDFT